MFTTRRLNDLQVGIIGGSEVYIYLGRGLIQYEVREQMQDYMA
jgi:hypothetical protein